MSEIITSESETYPATRPACDTLLLREEKKEDTGTGSCYVSVIIIIVIIVVVIITSGRGRSWGDFNIVG